MLSSIAKVAAACLAAHLLLAGSTLAASGRLPDWGQYLGYLRSFLSGDLGLITYDFSPWSPGIAVGALYLASAIAIVLLLRGNRALAERESPSILALCGATVYGITLFSYFVNRSADNILPYVSLPAILIAALWLGLLLRSPDVAPRWRLASLGSALAIGLLLVAVSFSSLELRFSQSALAHAIPGGDSMGAALARLWRPPPLKPQAPAGVRLLARYMRGEEESLVLTSADLSVEILLRAGRSSAFGFSDPVEDSFDPYQHLPDLRRVVSELEPGDLMLLDEPAAETFDAFRQDPSIEVDLDPEAPILDVATGPSGALKPLQNWLVKEIAARFDLVAVAAEEGLTVVRLQPRSASPPP